MMTTPINYLNHIEGRWLPAKSGDALESRNPADTRKLIATFPRSAPADAVAAVAAALSLPHLASGSSPSACGIYLSGWRTVTPT